MKSAPGVMTVRGCAYAGSKGVVWGPVKDMVHISHGPVGCGEYSWARRATTTTAPPASTPSARCTSPATSRSATSSSAATRSWRSIIDEIDELFPLAKGISIQSECPVGLIGDDIEAVAKASPPDIGKPVVPVRCEGFRGVSQSLGHHIANDAIRDHVFDNATATESRDALRRHDHRRLQHRRRRVGVAQSSRRWACASSRSGPATATLAELANAPKAKLNLIHCYRSMNYICRHMEEKYGIPWVEYNFFGPTKIYESIRAIAEHSTTPSRRRPRRSSRSTSPRWKPSSPSTGRGSKARP